MKKLFNPLFMALVVIFTTASKYVSAATSNIRHCSGSVSGKHFCTYEVGDSSSKIIINAPHGGSLEPRSILKDRDLGCRNSSSCVWSHTCGTKSTRCKASTSKDSWTKTIAERLRDKLSELIGSKPHLIVNNLNRKKMDGNRGEAEATFGDKVAMKAYTEYHDLINDAKSSIKGRGLFIDVHGQIHSHRLIELGYQVTKTRLNSGKLVSAYSSLRYLGKSLPRVVSFEDVVRGPQSLGHFLEQAYPEIGVMPSPKNPKPGARSYFIGGYNIDKYGSRYGGMVDGVQIEIHKDYRFNSTKRAKFINALAIAIKTFMDRNGY